MAVLGKLLITLSHNQLRTWSIKALSRGHFDSAMETSMDLGERFTATCMVHLPTYLNKV
jgi:hypothetical protein